MKSKARIVLVIAIAAAIGTAGASWKWRGHPAGHASAPYKVAGWSWGDGAQSTAVQPSS
jgi:hypothetical protein